MRRYHGVGASKGYAVGPVRLYRPVQVDLTGRFAGQTPGQQLRTLDELKTAAAAELTELRSGLAGDTAQAAIFQAHEDILADIVMEGEIRDMVGCGPATLDEAIRSVYSRYAGLMEGAADPVFRERARDIEDVRDRLLRLCAGGDAGLTGWTEPCILAARDLMPSDTAGLDREKVLAIVTEQGGLTSHSAIIARGCGIPALVGVGPFLADLEDGQTAAVDACQGVLTVDAEGAVWEDYRRKGQAYSEQVRETRRYLAQPALTLDGVRVEVTLNIASAGEKELSMAPYVDGVGLFRTEFLFMGRPDLPGEEEQTEIYRRVLTAFGGKPVTLRTLDIGGDKQCSCLDMPQEENPFLGRRALRLCFDREDVFRTQLRAALRASTAGPLWLMLPMVGSLDDLRRAKAILDDVKRELDGQGTAYDPAVKLGIMVEIPSIALLADRAAEEADFASIGSNDLCQYLMAADRLEPEVARYYQPMNPAMYRLIGHVIQAFAQRRKPVSLCGELGGDPGAAALLVGLGIRKLSMGADSVPGVKRMLCSITTAQAQAAAKQVQALGTAADAATCLASAFPQE